MLSLISSVENELFQHPDVNEIIDEFARKKTIIIKLFLECCLFVVR